MSKSAPRPETTSVAIVGAGIGGLTTALSLLRRGFQVQVYEQAPGLGEIGAGVQISPNAARVLHRLGLEAALAAVAVKPRSFQMRRWNDDGVLAQVELGAACEARFGAPYYSVHRGELHAVLVAATPAEVIHTNRRLSGFRQVADKVELAFEDGTTASADVMIGADGLKSVVRGRIVPDEPVFSGKAIVRGMAPADRVPDLVEESSVIMWVGPGKHMVSYPISGHRMINFGLATPAGTQRLESWVTEGTVEEAAQHLEGWNARARRLVTSADQTLVLPLYDREPAERLGDNRVTLLGDAAHPMLPFLAQGAGQAIEDAWVVADQLAADPGAAAVQLRAYEGLRAARAQEIQARSRANSEMFHLPDGEGQRMRDAMLSQMTIEGNAWLYDHDVTRDSRSTLAALASR